MNWMDRWPPQLRLRSRAASLFAPATWVLRKTGYIAGKSHLLISPEIYRRQNGAPFLALLSSQTTHSDQRTRFSSSLSAELRSAQQSLQPPKKILKNGKEKTFPEKVADFPGKGYELSGEVKGAKRRRKRREQRGREKGGFAKIKRDQMLKLCPLSSPTTPRHFLSFSPLFLLSLLPNAQCSPWTKGSPIISLVTVCSLMFLGPVKLVPTLQR